MNATDHKTLEQWEFHCEATTRRWRWRRRAADGSMLDASRLTFPSLHAALADATRNGFTYRDRPRSA